MDFTPEQHAELIAEQSKQETKSKYLAGYEKYKTKLWEYPLPSLVDNAIEEAIDEGTYLRTARQLMTELKSKAEQLFEIIDQPSEEPLDAEADELIDDIKRLLGL